MSKSSREKRILVSEGGGEGGDGRERVKGPRRHKECGHVAAYGHFQSGGIS
jgi:hypothetical protein